jgi:hypothetical protein
MSGVKEKHIGWRGGGGGGVEWREEGLNAWQRQAFGEGVEWWGGGGDTERHPAFRQE